MAYNLANFYSAQGRLVEAEEMLEQVLSLYERVFGLNNVASPYTTHYRGQLHGTVGKLAEAQELYEASFGRM